MTKHDSEDVLLPFPVKPYRIQMDCGVIVEAVLTDKEVRERKTWCPYHGIEGFRILVLGERI